MYFNEFPKIARLTRDCVVTEKIDGTNASVLVVEYDGTGCPPEGEPLVTWDRFLLWAGSRTRWVTPGQNDNYGFAAWVLAHARELVELGPGHHFGEWWGGKIQRGYGLAWRRFSLFNTSRWGDDRDLTKYPGARPACCDVVPVLYRGPFSTAAVDNCLGMLSVTGSQAAPGFAEPEGVVVYHEASRTYFKKTLEKDEAPKGQMVAA